MLRLVVFVGVDLLGYSQAGVAEDELGIAGRDAEVPEQGRSRVPEVMELDRPYAAGSADAVERADEVARLDWLPCPGREDEARPGCRKQAGRWRRGPGRHAVVSGESR